MKIGAVVIDHPPTGRHSATRRRDIVAELRRREETLHTQICELTALREEAAAAIQREAAGVVAAVRADISAIIINARRGLTELANELAAIEAARRTHSEDAVAAE